MAKNGLKATISLGLASKQQAAGDEYDMLYQL